MMMFVVVLYLVFSLAHSSLVFAVRHGVTICGHNYNCGASDDVCPELYGAQCSVDDPDCVGPNHCVQWICNGKDVDSDGGDKPLSPGYVKDFSCAGRSCAVSGPSYDSCSGNTLTEYFLSGGSRSSRTYDCDDYDTESAKHCSGDSVVKDVDDYWCACTASNGCFCNHVSNPVVVEDCNDYDDSDCNVLSLDGDELTVECDDYSCANGQCVVSGTITKTIACDESEECKTYDSYTCRFSNGAYEWTSDLGKEQGVDCNDAHDNDCDVLIDGNDPSSCEEGDGGLGCDDSVDNDFLIFFLLSLM